MSIARSTEGVTRVDDRLRVRNSTPDNASSGESAGAGGAGTTAAGRHVASGRQTGDGWITVKIESKYFLHTDVKGRDINAWTQNGAVTLRGDGSRN